MHKQQLSTAGQSAALVGDEDACTCAGVQPMRSYATSFRRLSLGDSCVGVFVDCCFQCMQIKNEAVMGLDIREDSVLWFGVIAFFQQVDG